MSQPTPGGDSDNLGHEKFDNLSDISVCEEEVQNFESTELKKKQRHSKVYQIVNDEKRRQLIELITGGHCNIRAAAAQLSINYSTAKTILQTFKNEGRVEKKKKREKLSTKLKKREVAQQAQRLGLEARIVTRAASSPLLHNYDESVTNSSSPPGLSPLSREQNMFTTKPSKLSTSSTITTTTPLLNDMAFTPLLTSVTPLDATMLSRGLKFNSSGQVYPVTLDRMAYYENPKVENCYNVPSLNLLQKRPAQQYSNVGSMNFALYNTLQEQYYPQKYVYPQPQTYIYQPVLQQNIQPCSIQFSQNYIPENTTQFNPQYPTLQNQYLSQYSQLYNQENLPVQPHKFAFAALTKPSRNEFESGPSRGSFEELALEREL